jgi:acetylornithine/succinyldiaminopimelate/putrescine aminotransferase
MLSQRQLFLKHVAQTSAFPLLLEIERAEGLYLYDHKGKSYIDLIAGIGVSALGHRHPAVLKAVIEQSDKYWHTMVYGEFVLSPQVRLATLLAAHTAPNLDSVYFTNSGTEAVEGAMKLAKRYTGRTEIISAYNAYHGSTQGALSLNSDPYFTQSFRPLLPDIQHITYNDLNDLNTISTKTAAVIIEVIQAEAGIYPSSTAYLQALRKRCTETGTLLIFDEIQTGMGRTGTLWAFQRYKVVPDVLLSAKGLGGGLPIGAFISSKKIMSALTDEPILGHITTFGGHPLSAAAAFATLKTLLETDLINQVAEKSLLFQQKLKHPLIQAVRGSGLMLAVELSDFDMVQKVIARCLENGLLTDWFLFNNKCLRIAPPLTITVAEIERACAILLEAIEKVPIN